jgi:hypothetical protein
MHIEMQSRKLYVEGQAAFMQNKVSSMEGLRGMSVDLLTSTGHSTGRVCDITTVLWLLIKRGTQLGARDRKHTLVPAGMNVTTAFAGPSYPDCMYVVCV